MRPTLKTQALGDMGLLFEDVNTWTIACIYSPKSGTPVVFDCFLSGQIDTFTSMETYVRGEDIAEIYIWAKHADVPNPQWRDKFTLQGTDWYFGSQGVVKNDEYSMKIHLERDFECT